MNENIRFIRPLYRGLPFIILAIVLSILAAKKYLGYVTPIYESTAMLKLADTQEGVPSANLFKDFDVFASANKINTEIEVLKSSSLIEKTLSKLPFSTEIYRKGDLHSAELFKNTPFFVEGTFSSDKNYDKKFSLKILSHNRFQLTLPGKETAVEGNFGEPITISGGKLLITLNKNFILSKPGLKMIDEYEFEFLSHEKLLEKTNKNLDIVSVDKDVPVIRINFKSNVPEKAELFVNTLAETYIQDYIESKYKAADTTTVFLKNEIKEARAKLTSTENQIQNYRDHNNIINIPQETETDLRKISQLKIQQSNIKMNLDAANYLNNYISQGKSNYLELAPNFEAFNDLLSTEMVKNMKNLQAEKKELLLTYTPEHEKVKIIDAKLKDLTDYQTESIKNTAKNLQIKYRDINKDIGVAEQAFVGLPEKERILNVLNREFNLYEKNYNFLNEKRIDAEIAKSAKISFHKVITPGEIPKSPVSPVRSIIIIVAAIIGMITSIAAIYLVHYAKAKVNDVYTIEKNSNIPIAFTTPYIKNESENISRLLQNITEMELKGILKDHNTITVTSYDKEKDHLFLIENTMKALEKQHRKVILIDIAGNFPYQSDNIIDLSGNEILFQPRKQLEHFIHEASQGYELCIINNVAVKKNTLALLLMSLANQNLFILDSRKTAEKRILEVEILNEEYQFPKLWFVLNKAGYTPSIIKYLIKCITSLKNK
ncbi:hypothetical protein H5J24_09545 [Chryseobacterium capnotolerans]|uniref:GumC family protein n=1 Tax=Chryseobacterium TaxID=59732 RepID=UPI00083A5001|nr:MULTISPECIES: Wzz/FepE/Etk N-terminal domain-containing protein [Chryseobacterium]UHO40209.1 hypothetical protein H5J24_09545 [Chryseobacterium capnotolerans]